MPSHFLVDGPPQNTRKTVTMKYTVPLFVALVTAKVTSGHEEAGKVRGGDMAGAMRDLKRMSQFRNNMRLLQGEDSNVDGDTRKLKYRSKPAPSKETSAYATKEVSRYRM
jgi:hypothetical protein